MTTTTMAQTVMTLTVEMTAQLMPVETLPLTEVEMPLPLVALMRLGTLPPQPVALMRAPTRRQRRRRFAPEGCLQGLAAQPLETTLVMLAPALLAPMSRRAR
jgi:hypothetical protein